jgi:hypothetical protein
MGIQDTPVTSDGRRLFILHAILMHTGRVLVWSGHTEDLHYAAEAYEWDPIGDPNMTGSVRRNFPAGVDIFCCHQTNLEDGRVMTVGGSAAGPPHARGIRDICIYDPAGGVWSQIGQMSVGRWYPTLITLADGSVLAFSGHDESGLHLASSVEQFRLPIQGPGYTPQVLAGGDKPLATYPGLHLVPGGKVVLTGTTWRYALEQSAPINTFTFRKLGASSGAWTDQGMAPAVNNREEGMSILLPPAQDGKLLLVGGGWWSDHGDPSAGHRAGTNLNSAASLDTQTSPMQWRSLTNMHHPRMNVSAVLLPDAKVLVHGGHNSYKWSNTQIASNVAEIYDAVLDTWTEVATMNERRTYHSTSLLLPDGQVVTMGGVDPSRNEPGSSSLNQKTFEFYRPPYFFKGTRPAITSVTSQHGPIDRLAYGTSINIAGTSDTPLLRVALMRLGAMTHHTDSEQRYVALNFVVSAYDAASKDFTLTAGVTSDANVAPPGYYMLWVIDDQERPCARARIVHLSRRQCSIVTDRSHFAHDELQTGGNTDFDDAFYVIMDGFRPDELGITTATPSQAQIDAWSPTINFTKAVGGAAAPSMAALPRGIILEDVLGAPQRVAFKYTVRFASGDAFFGPAVMPIEEQQVLINASKNGYTCHSPVRLTHQPRPFMLDGDPHWLSSDVRVFSLRQNATRFGHNVGDSSAASLAFINAVLNDFNNNTATGVTEFDAILPQQDQSPVYLSELFPGTTDRVYNFAVAKVHYRGKNLPANNIGVFFRLFRALATGVEFRQNSTYRTIVNAFGERIPALGIEGGQTTTIPFYAEARVNTAVQSLTQQRDQANRRNLLPVAPGSTERFAFFGCWLDINQSPARFPLAPPNPIGPFSSGLESIPRLLRSAHCCLVAEVDFGANWLQDGDSPASNDSLSQRNLAVIGSDNPGSPATHTVLHTFEIKPSAAMGIGGQLKDIRDFEVVGSATQRAPSQLVHRRADELMIEWGNLPEGTNASIYMPGIKADEVMELHLRRPGPANISVIDAHTLGLVVTAQRVTYLPLPPSRHATVASLFSIELPDTVRKQNVYHLTVRQIAGSQQTILGSCEWLIPVTTADRLLPFEESRFAVFQHIAQGIPANDQWAAVFGRYLDHQRDKVRGLGGNPDEVKPSPLGHVPGGGEGVFGKRFCCRLEHMIAIFAIVLILAVLLPGPAALTSAAAVLSGGAIIAALIVRMIHCRCQKR